MKTGHPPFDWDLGAEIAGDRAVRQAAGRLAGRRIALHVTGGIAACRIPIFARALRREGATVIPFATPAALRFVAEAALAWCAARDVVTRLDEGAQHVETSALDAHLVAPATYCTIAKLAAGIADNAVTTTLAAALGRLEAGRTRILVAPAMHGSMVNAVLKANLARLVELGVEVIPPRGEDGKAKLPEDEALIAALLASSGP